MGKRNEERDVALRLLEFTIKQADLIADIVGDINMTEPGQYTELPHHTAKTCVALHAEAVKRGIIRQRVPLAKQEARDGSGD